MQKPVEPVRSDFEKYINIGKGYVEPIKEALESGTLELANRKEIVPYTSTGTRDVLGMNTIACLDGISEMLGQVKTICDGYENPCNDADQEDYNEALDEYNRLLEAYNKWVANYENKQLGV